MGSARDTGVLVDLLGLRDSSVDERGDDLLGLAGDGLFGSEGGLSSFLVERVDEGEEAGRDSVGFVGLDGSLDDRIRESVTLSKVLGDDGSLGLVLLRNAGLLSAGRGCRGERFGGDVQVS